MQVRFIDRRRRHAVPSVARTAYHRRYLGGWKSSAAARCSAAASWCSSGASPGPPGPCSGGLPDALRSTQHDAQQKVDQPCRDRERQTATSGLAELPPCRRPVAGLPELAGATRGAYARRLHGSPAHHRHLLRREIGAGNLDRPTLLDHVLAGSHELAAVGGGMQPVAGQWLGVVIYGLASRAMRFHISQSRQWTEAESRSRRVPRSRPRPRR